MSRLRTCIALLKIPTKVISSEGLAEAEAEKSVKPVPIPFDYAQGRLRRWKTDFSTLFASLTTVEMTGFQQSKPVSAKKKKREWVCKPSSVSGHK